MKWQKTGTDENTSLAGDSAFEVTAYYSDGDRSAIEITYYVTQGAAGRLGVEQMMHEVTWRVDDPDHEQEPESEDYTYDAAGLFDFPDTEEGMQQACAEVRKFAGRDESGCFA